MILQLCFHDEQMLDFLLFLLVLNFISVPLIEITIVP